MYTTELLNIDDSREVVSFDFKSLKNYGNLTKEDGLLMLTALQKLERAQSTTKFLQGALLLAISENTTSFLSDYGVKDIYELAKVHLGMARGTVSERMQVAKRFKQADSYAIEAKYASVNYTTLKELKDLTDGEIVAIGVKLDGTMTALDVKDAKKQFIKKTQTELLDNSGNNASDSEPTENSDDNGSDSEPTENSDDNGSDSEPTEKSDNSSDSESTETVESIDIIDAKFDELPNYIKTNLQKYFNAQKLSGNFILRIEVTE